MKKKNYEAPKVKELGLAKDIIKDVLRSGSGDSFPGVNATLASN